MIERICLDPLYYKRIGHVILGFKNLVLNEWCDVMVKQTTSADKLAIFALSKIYQRHMVIFNASKPWSTLEPDGEMLEEELFENCQIHLAYMGKYQYAMLHRKLFIEQAALPTLKSMLDPMKIQHTNKRMCQKEPMDLSLQVTRSADVSLDIDNSFGNIDTSQKPEDEGESNQDLLGGNQNNENNVDVSDVPAVPQNKIVETPEHDKYKKALDAICKTWTEVKLLQMKTSDIEFYLNKNRTLKGDNMIPDPTNSPVQRSHSGRPIRKATSTVLTGVDESNGDSDYESDFVKSPGRKQNYSKPRASGPSASRVAAQNKKSGVPATVLPSTSNTYKCSDSPDYSDNPTNNDNASSSGSSHNFEPDISDDESDKTFDGFDPSDLKPPSKLGKGLLNTVQYRL